MSGLAAKARSILSSLGAEPKKSFGQNFMISEPHLKRIAGALESPAGASVLEIGPGLGFLTACLLERGYRVWAVEKDRRFARSLGQRLQDPRLSVIEGDILRLDPDVQGLGGPFAVAGNIPYNITSPILEWLVTRRFQGSGSGVTEAVLTIQKEVAERLAARPGGKTWGALTVFVQTFADVTRVCAISRGAFLPPPNVDSAAVHLKFLPSVREDLGDERLYFFLVRKAFQKRRKTLANALEDPSDDRLSRQSLPAWLESLGVDPRRRPETLSLAEWARLSRRLSSPASA